MVASFGACKDSVTKPIQVMANPVARFYSQPYIFLQGSADSKFFKYHTGAQIHVSWNFGDGTSSKLANPSHTYLKEGFYSGNAYCYE